MFNWLFIKVKVCCKRFANVRGPVLCNVTLKRLVDFSKGLSRDLSRGLSWGNLAKVHTTPGDHLKCSSELLLEQKSLNEILCSGYIVTMGIFPIKNGRRTILLFSPV